MQLAQPYGRVASSPRFQAAGTSYTPAQIAALYDFPKVPTGPDQVIAIGELGGGYVLAQVQAFFSFLGLPAPVITDVSVRGAQNSPGDPRGADGEVMLDILVAAAAYSYCTGTPAQLLLVFAPNDASGMADAVQAALGHASKPSVFSWSWGGPEDTWGAASLTAMEAALKAAAAAGLTVTAAAGDNGSGDGERGNHVDYPASSAWVLACGGTSVQTSGGKITRETVWNDGAAGGSTGGGFSTLFPRPAWQNSFAQSNGRGVPDVAANADPQTGYQIVVDGQSQVIGGTSAVAPLMAGLVAVLNRALGQRLGLVNPLFYSAEPTFRDVVSGNNGIFQAGVGWDADTGLGSPDGSKLLGALRGGPPPPTRVEPTAARVKAATDAGILTGLQQTLAKLGRRPTAPATVLNAALPLVTAQVNAEVDAAFGA